MSEDEIRNVESSQRQHHEEMEHQSRSMTNALQEEYVMFSLLKPMIIQDGNQWCVLYGDNLQEGICGFGDTPHKAVMAWNCAWHEKLGNEAGK